MLSVLRTGEVGPLKLRLTIREVSELLGRPNGGRTEEARDLCPLLWGYRPFLGG